MFLFHVLKLLFHDFHESHNRKLFVNVIYIHKRNYLPYSVSFAAKFFKKMNWKEKVIIRVNPWMLAWLPKKSWGWLHYHYTTIANSQSQILVYRTSDYSNAVAHCVIALVVLSLNKQVVYLIIFILIIRRLVKVTINFMLLIIISTSRCYY